MPGSEGEEQGPRSVLSGGAGEHDWDIDALGGYELCCFVSHKGTSTEAAIWRNVARRQVVLAFRGTSDVLDAVTDVNLFHVPLEEREDGKRSPALFRRR